MPSLRARLTAANRRSPISSSICSLRPAPSSFSSSAVSSFTFASGPRTSGQSNAGGSLLQPVRHEQGRQRGRQSREGAALPAGPRLTPFHELPPGMVIPADARFTEEIRMAPPHFLFERARDDFRIELRALFGDRDLEREMQQQVAQLIAHRFGIVGLNGVIELERFFDQIGTERLRGLRAVPRTPLAQFTHESQSTSKR